MKRLSVLLVAALVVLGLAMAGCSSSAPPAPTQPPSSKAAEPAKATEPTKAAAPATAPAPTAVPAAPAKASSFPDKSKTINLVVPYPAGGGSDIAVRILQPILEKEIGVPVQLVNKGGAGSQVGVTEAAKAKPDGYTIGHANWPTIITL